MKTKELKKIVEENGYDFEKKMNRIYITKDSELVIQLTDEDIIMLNHNYVLQTKQIKTVMKALIEYSETPIEEREEEKKYYVEFGDKLDKLSKNRYLNLNITNNVFFFHFNWLDLEDFDSGHLKFKGKFTQSEIDNFPPEIKGAIECGFLKKVEVE